MQSEGVPYVCHCGFCEQGMLRLARCLECRSIAARCDECELIWSDIAAVREHPDIPSEAAHPACPACGVTNSRWQVLDEQAARDAQLLHLTGRRRS